ncbi:MliC family protein [Neisseria sp.]|uniref:MliC family protein n=1 Tax=Neisseria sp. TaxID=192066 RepID=UPI0035A12355
MKLTKLILPACLAAMLSACAADGYSDNYDPYYDEPIRDTRNIDRDRDFRDRDFRDRDRRHSHDFGRDDSRRHVSVFRCRNAFDVRLERHGLDSVTAEYGLSDSMGRAVLTRARSGSGELYVSGDRKVEWHEKGREGVLTFSDRYGNVTETTCRESR